MMLNLAKGDDFSVCVCVCTSGDLLNRPRFQFHASEFDRGGGGENGGEREREKGSLAGNVPSGRTDGKDGGMEGGRRAGKRTKYAGRKCIPTSAKDAPEQSELFSFSFLSFIQLSCAKTRCSAKIRRWND